MIYRNGENYNMSSLVAQLNKNHGNSPFKVNAKDFDYINLKTLYIKDGEDASYKVLGVYINEKGRFGAEPLAIIDGFKVNLPKHVLKDVQMILDNEEMIQAINDGHLGFQIEPYENTRGQFYSVRWVEM